MIWSDNENISMAGNIDERNYIDQCTSGLDFYLRVSVSDLWHSNIKSKYKALSQKQMYFFSATTIKGR